MTASEHSSAVVHGSGSGQRPHGLSVEHSSAGSVRVLVGVWQSWKDWGQKVHNLFLGFGPSGSSWVRVQNPPLKEGVLDPTLNPRGFWPVTSAGIVDPRG